MFKTLTKHWLAYLILFAGLAAAATLYLLAWPDRSSLRMISLGLAVFYVIWGVITHLHHDRISSSVVVEYVAVGSLSAMLLILLTL